MLSRPTLNLLKMPIAAMAWLGWSLNAPAAGECRITAQPPDLGSTSNLERLHQGAPAGARPHFHSVHGQAVFGSETVHLSHLAVHMIAPAMHPHNFQIVQRVSFRDPEQNAVYRQHRSKHGDALYTAVPPGFDQDDLVASATLDNTRIFLGHFEQGGEEIAPTPFDLEIDDILYFHEIIPDGERLSSPHYIVFGAGEEIFAERLISATPDFQQMVRVGLTPIDADLSGFADALANGLFVELPDRENTLASRLKLGQSVDCSLATAAGDTAARDGAASVTLSVVSEEYCEEGELSAPVTDSFNAPKRCDP